MKIKKSDLITLIFGLIIFIIVLYFVIVFFLFYMNYKPSGNSCNLSDCAIFRYNFTNAVNNLNTNYSIGIDRLREFLTNGK